MGHNKKPNNSSSKSHMNTCGSRQRNRVLINKLSQLKKEIQAERELSVLEKLERSREVVDSGVLGLRIVSESVNDKAFIYNGSCSNKLDQKMENPIHLCPPLPDSGDTPSKVAVSDGISSINRPVGEIVHAPCETWMFRRNKNQKMAVDRSIGRRWNRLAELEALRIVEEEDRQRLEKEKHKLLEYEDRILRMVVQEFELTEDVLNILTEHVTGTIAEIQERCNYLKEKDQATHKQYSKVPEKVVSVGAIPFEKRLDEASRTFDGHFCRTCYVFGCRKHKIGEDVTHKAEKQPYIPEPDSHDRKPCSKSCYLVLEVPNHPVEGHSMDPAHSEGLRKRRASHLDVTKVAEASSSKKIKATTGDYAPGKERGHTVKYEAESKNKVFGLPGRSEWRPLEKDLLNKGIEIFGRDSCLITRNMLSGMKTCAEVFSYMNAAKKTSNAAKETSDALKITSNNAAKITSDAAEKKSNAVKRTSRSGGSDIKPPGSCADDHEQVADNHGQAADDVRDDNVNGGVMVNRALGAMFMSLTIASAVVWHFCS